MFRGSNKSPPPAAGAGTSAGRAASGGEVVVQKVDKIEQVQFLNMVSRPSFDVDREAEKFIRKQRSMW
jgi:hypothetical protein